MRKIIHSSFELDLSNFKLQDVEQNSMFYDTFFTKYSFPFIIDLEKHLDIATGFISHYNSSDIVTYFEVLYQHYNKIEKAIFEIEEMQQQLSCTVRFGFDELPSFSKKLSELPLDNFDLPIGESIYLHAETIIRNKWPNVNYNFPQIHTDKYNDDEEFLEFKKIINNKKGGAFLENEYDAVEHINYNRNIMQPLPYILHVVTQGMFAAGYQLAGTILNDNYLKKVTLFADVNYFKKREEYSTNAIQILVGDYYTIDTSVPVFPPALYNERYTIVERGIYKLVMTVVKKASATYLDAWPTEVKINDVTITVDFTATSSEEDEDGYYFRTIEYIGIFEISSVNSTLEISFGQRTFPDSIERIICEGNVLMVSPYDSLTESYTSSIINENKIDLTKAVANATFGDLIKFIKNYLNYDITKIEDGFVYMDPIESSINYSNSEDFSKNEIKYPTRKFSQGKSFLLKFMDIDSEQYSYQSVFHNKAGFAYSNYTTDEKTATIEINGLPLPLKNENFANTAHAFENNESKFYLVIYDGLNNNTNFSYEITKYLLPNIHESYWKLWFEKRISSISYLWSFTTDNYNLLNLSIKKNIFAYRNHHIIKSITKTESKPNEFDIEIETETI